MGDIKYGGGLERAAVWQMAELLLEDMSVIEEYLIRGPGYEIQGPRKGSKIQ